MASKKDSYQRENHQEVFVISVAAQKSGLHAQTLRTYDRLGLVTPQRTSGGGRRYTNDDVDRLKEIQRLSQDEGVNLAGIKEIIRLNEEKDLLHARLRELEEENEQLRQGIAQGSVPRGRELVHVPRSTAIVVWESRAQRRRRAREQE